jgi:hypothetical protein
MATVTKGRTFVSGEVVTPNKLNTLVDSATVTGIVNADIDAAAAIVDTKLATIATAGKVANTATTATSANTASAIVARDASGNFSAGTITASLSGNATTATSANAIADGVVSTTAKIANGVVTPAKLTQPLTLATAQATTSGTAIDFTGIPSWANRITVMLQNVAVTGTSLPIIQIGVGTTPETTGYIGSTTRTIGASVASGSFSSGVALYSSAVTWSCDAMIVVFTKITGNTWCVSGTGASSASGNWYLCGYKSLAGALGMVRLTTAAGSAAFNSGSINVMYEG